MPVQAFDAQDAPPGLTNYWGYSPLSFFAPHPLLRGGAGAPLGVLDEFRTMVKELHRAGIEVILDVVFNHTAEGDAAGPTLRLARARQRGLLPARPGEHGDVPGLHRLRQHHERAIIRRAADDRRVRCTQWVDRTARRRLPLRSRLDPRPATPTGRPMANPPILSEIGVTRARRHQADRRSLGRRRPLPGGVVRRRALARNGTGASATTSGASCAAMRGSVARIPNRLLGSPDLYPGSAREAVSQHQLHHLPRRVHPQRPCHVRRASTTRPTW